jgi:hypothetical protein
MVHVATGAGCAIVCLRAHVHTMPYPVLSMRAVDDNLGPSFMVHQRLVLREGLAARKSGLLCRGYCTSVNIQALSSLGTSVDRLLVTEYLTRSYISFFRVVDTRQAFVLKTVPTSVNGSNFRRPPCQTSERISILQRVAVKSILPLT